MKNQSTDQPGFDVALAHCFARVALGLCIALHGYSRLPNLVGFANGMVKQFAATFLPSPLVYVTGFGTAIGEAIIGTLLIFGIFLRPTLVVGTLLMLQLIFGTTLIQQWESRFDPTDLCCVLRRTARNGSPRSFFHRRPASAGKGALERVIHATVLVPQCMRF
jgi:thiosulfate dehydrogenase (quinone) large subunit